jgi:hypothetical protein
VWNDLLSSAPDYLVPTYPDPGSWVTIIVTFTALADTTGLPGAVTTNTITADGVYADPDGGGPLPPQAPVPTQQGADAVQIVNPTGIEGLILGDFAVEPEGDTGARVLWRTESETNMLGFHVMRRHKGMATEFTRVSDLITANYTGQDQGDDYVYVDENLPGGTWQYRLEVIYLDGQPEMDGLDEVTISRWMVYVPVTYRHK